MSEGEIDQQIERVAMLITAGNDPYIEPGTVVMMHVGQEQFPVGTVIAAYKSISMHVASLAHDAVEHAESRSSHSWALATQNVLCLLIVIGGVVVLLQGWP